MFLSNLYNNYIFKYHKSILTLLLSFLLFFGYFANKLNIDASSDTLILEGDKDLAYTQLVNKRYYSPDFLILAYTPKEGLLSKNTIETIENISAKLLQINNVDSVTSILNVPILMSPPRPITELVEYIPTLKSQNIDLDLVKKEFISSPLYSDNLVSRDFKTTSIIINLKEDKVGLKIRDERNLLREKNLQVSLNDTDLVKLNNLEKRYNNHKKIIKSTNEKTINQIREIIKPIKDKEIIFLGGLGMITNDVIAYVKQDLKIFGFSILLFLIITLVIIFRQFRWIIIPIVTCFFSVVVTSGVLGIFGWDITIISSNFISLQLIFTMAITVHLTVKYRELYFINADVNQKQLLIETLSSMAKPCFYTVATTIVGFSSLVFSGLLPVINFGWMMSIGIIISLISSFILFPILQIHLNKVKPNVGFEKMFPLPEIFSKVSNFIGKKIIFIALIILFFGVIGIFQLRVENSFIDYFKNNSEIYKGMKLIDQKLGGTTLLDITVDLEEELSEEIYVDEDSIFEDDEFDFLEEDSESMNSSNQLFFTSSKMELISIIHDYLNDQPEIGKVMSFATLLKVGKELNNKKELDIIQLALLYSELPDKYKKIIVSPYLSIENNQAKFSLRIKDSMPSLRRNELINRLKTEIPNIANISKERVHFSNVLILYNNMLQSLFKSQILTLGTVIILLFIMFLLLFKSFKTSLIALFPNIISISLVLGFMGWFKIPLDMMTITIAAISMGIAVDNTIHYIYRFRNELIKDNNYSLSMYRTHMSIGFAMYYTSVTIIVGFCILIFSNFIPSIYFGILTSIAMLMALLSSLILLPQLLILFKPFEK
ncbi:MAG: MMPL family transporter [Alphaproteobacteria bacterium]|nr:MMPL family transporter [Alphaproteobacteria bacterium]